ncbi:MAG: hypothetical protein IT210_10520 [Armatimonadetes bacterium]|nr:hypothetical protein [Armatimonadota bacterium]
MLNVERTRQYLKDFDFRSLFIEELGWDHHTLTFPVNADGQTYTLKGIAEKRGVHIFECSPDAEGGIPTYSLRQQIERQAAKTAYEHLIIFTDADRTRQIWQWVSKEPSKPLAYREHTYYRGQSGLPLIQRLNQIVFRLDEEEGLTIDLVAFRLKDALNKEHVTRRFYDRFKTEHDAFLGFLKGIPDDKLQRWYVSVMLNRLMFIYFVQKKGFLNGDTDYLRNRLNAMRQTGRDRFYQDFLCPLFFEGFAKRPEDRSSETRRLLGTVPYLNGGLFLKHQIEEQHGEAIRIEDEAFERLFAFFEQYR